MKSVCGARRFDKYKCTADKPSNQTLHKENEQKLNDLLRIREEQDNRVFPPITKNDVTKNSIAESLPGNTPMEQILYYPTSDVKEKRESFKEIS